MTIREAISRANPLKPNGYEDPIKVQWLDALDRKIYNDIISAHEGYPDVFEGYSEKTNQDTVLLAPDDYAELYVYYIVSMIDYYNGETTRYVNDTRMYNSAYDSFVSYYNRTYTPVYKGNFKVI